MNRRSFLQLSSAAAVAAALPARAAEPRNGIPYRRLGRTGEQVSCLCVGGSHIGRGISEEDAIRLMRTAVDEGLNFFDNAWHYNDGASEERMGKALKDGYRGKVFLMTKHKGRDARTAQEYLESSLKRLQVDTIDLWQFHEVIRPEEPSRIYAQGALDYALKAKEEGKIRYIGFTGHHLTTALREMIELGFEWDTVQMPLNAFDHHYRSFEHRVLPLANEKGLGVIAMKSMGHGDFLATGAITPAECLRYSLALPVATVCCGMDSIEILHENLDTVRKAPVMQEEERQTLLARTRPLAEEGKHEVYKTTWHRQIQQDMQQRGLKPA